MCGLLTFGAGTASAAEPPDIAQLVAAMQQEGQNAAEKAAFTGGGYRASLLRTAETAAQAAAAAPVSAPAQEDPGETGGDEEPSEPAPVTQHSIHDENGYYVHNGSAYNSITKDGLWVGGTDENTGFHVDSDGNVTTTGSITVNRTGGAGSVTIDASTGKITGVAKGDINENSTDAVNGSQLYYAIQEAEGTTYAAGDGVVIADGSTTGEDKTISVKAGNGIEVGADGVAVKVNGNNLTVNENGLSLSETLSGLTSVTASGTITAGNVKINADNSGKITGLAEGEISDTSTDAVTGKQLNDVKEAAEELDGLAVKYTNKNKTAVDLGSATLTTTGAITGGSMTVDGVTVDNGKITGLATESITGDTDATNKKYVDDKVTTAIGELDIPEYSAGNGIDITGETISAKAKENGNIVVDGDGISLAADVKDLTSVTATGAITAGSFSGTSASIGGIGISSGKITGLTTASITENTDAANKEYVDKAVADIDVPEYKAGNGIAITGDTISAKAKENGNIVVDGDGISLAKEVTGLTSVTATGAITAGSFSGTSASIGGIGISSGKITGLTTASITENTDAANKEYVDKAVADIDVPEYKAGNGIAITGDTISAKAKENGNIVVDGDGISLAKEVTGLTSVTATGAITAGSFSGTSASIGGIGISSGKITGLTTASITENTDAANKEYVDKAVADIDVPEYKAGNGIAITGDTISAKAKQDGNIVVDENGISLATEVSGLTSVATEKLTATGAITGGSFVVNGKTYISDAGLNANSQKITNVAAGDIKADSTDAVNGGQLQQVYDAMKKIDGTTYADGDGISISGDDNTISVNAGKGLEIADDKVQVNLKDDEKNLELLESGELTLKDALNVTSVKASNGFLIDSNTSFTSDGLKIGGKTYVSSAGLNANGSVITGVSDAKDADDAVNLGQLNEKLAGLTTEGTKYKPGSGIKIDGDTISAKVKENGNIVVDENGISLATKVSGLTSVATGTLTATGAITGGSFAVGDKTYISDAGLNANSQKITNVLKGEADTDAVNVGQLNEALKGVKGTAYEAGNKGITVDNENDKISAKADEKNVTVGENGIALKDDISVVSVTTSGDVTIGGALNVTGATTLNGALTANGTATFTQGASMGGQKITNVKAGEAGTDAVNKSQLDAVQSQIKDYTAGDGISIDDDSDEISVAYGDGLTTDRQGNLLVNAGDGLGFNEDDNSLEVVTGDGLTISRNGEVTAAVGNGLDFDSDGKIVVEAASGGNLTVDSNGISLNKELTGLTGISTETLTASSGITVGGTQYISTSGLNAGNHVITNVADGQNKNDAVNYGQLSALQEDFTELNDLAVTYDAANKTAITLDGTGGTKITNVAAGDISKADSTDAVNGGQLYATNQIVGDGKWNTGSNYLTGDVEDLTDAANALDSAIGNNRYTGDNVLNANTDGKTYTSVTAAISTLDSNIGNLTMTSAQAYYSQGTKVNVTAALDRFSSLFGPMNFSEAGAHYINNDANVSSALMIFDSNLWRIDKNFDAMLQNVGFRKVGDEFTTTIDWSDSSYGEGTTIVTAIKDLDDRVLTLEGKNPAGQSLAAFSNMSAANVSALSALSNMDTETAETLASMSSEQVETLAAKAPAAAPAAPAPGDPAATSTRPGPDGESETGDTGDAYEVKQDLHVTGDTTLDGALTVDGAGTFNDGLTVNTKTEGGTALTVNGGASINGTLNMNDNKITGVADGEISETSTDAVNGSQLWGVQQDIENNASAIASLGGQVSRLDNRIDRVGAGAAALAALHPLDYDPEVKWDFAAGYGNYRGANAVSVGAFYRPNEDVMFSVGGSMGGGENMVNAGVSFKLGSGSGLTTSRTAMARELAAMKDTVAAQNAQIEAQAKQIEELTALVAQLAAEKAGAPEEKKA